MNSFPLPAVLLTALQENHVFNRQGQRVPLHSNVSLEEAETLYRAVRTLQPQASVEIGFAQGISATALLKAMADSGTGIHHIIDPFQARFEEAGLMMVDKAGLTSRMRFYRQFAEETVPSLPPIQFAFIDSSHLFDLSLHEFVMVDKKLEAGGVIAFHDTWMPSLQKVIRYLLTNRSYRIRRDFQPAPRAFTKRERCKLTLAHWMRHLPACNELFNPECLQPWCGFQLENLVFLEKIKHDERDWQFHATF